MNQATTTAFDILQVTKRFGSVEANRDVTFSVRRGSIHGVVGENGAGKSTIMKVLYGLYPPDSGEIRVHGTVVSIPNPHEAIRLGIGMVHQHFMLVPTLPVWQNIILGHEPHPWSLNPKYYRTQLTDLMHGYGFNLDLDAIVETLPVGKQQQVEILKLLYRQADILILDEPTGVLTPQEVASLWQRLRVLQAQNKTIVLITHKLKEILEITENVTVMRGGRVIETTPTVQLTEETLAEKIVGRKTQALPARSSSSANPVRIRVENLTAVDDQTKILDNVSFSIRRGEVYGIAGISGNGQEALVEVLSQVREVESGTIEIDSVKTPMKDARLRTQSAVVPADRHHEGLVLEFSVRENFLLGHQREARFCKGPWIDFEALDRLGTEWIKNYDIRPHRMDLPVRALSGGNQQKVIFARELRPEIRFILAAYPTRGVDIGAIEFIHKELLRYREEGCAILLISSELDELLTLSDRLGVMYGGRIVGEVDRGRATEMQLGLWMTGGGAA